MKVMLDTNICIALINQKPAKVLAQLKQYKVGEVCISAVTLAELQYGVAKSLHQQKNTDALQQFILPLEVVGFDEAVTSIYGELRAHLEKQGTPIGALDMMIAAHALSLNVKLVTNNTKEFKRAVGLELLDWLD
jgi:tRNA(fMet)-specific endonuclease VapC